ncbi:MAG: hypothetical protein P8Y25_10720, partial [Chromatiaceae bacterium]
MTTHVLNEEQLQKMKAYPGFIAALDQSGGSTPHALALYGIKDHSWADDNEMFDLVHEMRTRIITSPGFSGERIIAAILFEDTMDREIEGRPTADYLWNVKRVVGDVIKLPVNPVVIPDRPWESTFTMVSV